jgi:hypothetical protein
MTSHSVAAGVLSWWGGGEVEHSHPSQGLGISGDLLLHPPIFLLAVDMYTHCILRMITPKNALQAARRGGFLHPPS